MSGAQGPTGHTGATGRKGIQGTPYGAPGTTFYSPSGRITTVSRPTNALSVTAADYGTTYIMTYEAGNITVTLPDIIPETDYGAFWTFRNNSGFKQFITLTNTAGVVYNGDSAATYIPLESANAITLVFSGSSNTTSTYIAI